MMFAALALALLVGIALGLLGGGGSILTLPILTYVAGMETKAAIAASLFVVAVTSATGVITHARAGRVRWRTGLLFGAAGMVGAYGGGRVAAYIPGQALMVAFALMMLATAFAMLRGRRVPALAPATARRELPIGKILAEGIVVGVVTGIVGAGGGFLVVPALALLGGLSMEVAVGTSLVVISMKSFAGFYGHLQHVDGLDWPLTLGVTAIAVVGSFAGAALAGRVPPQMLRKGFGAFVLLMAAFVLSRELM
ncbi:MAG: sulfite exporter TauE/SafE family protein [Deltaproteobacteria bacterium]|nr:sulfite exporter TauE/SafE family protein [Kofleriaceae bacterium]